MKLAKKLKKTMGLMLISTMVLSAAPVMAADYDNHWAKEAIAKWSEYEVVTGYGDDVFKPNNEVKRAELAAFISRVFGLETTKGATKFTDVSATAWYAEDIAKVSAAGIMQGASGKFNPNGFATREEVAVTLVNAFGLTGSGEMNFKDQDQIAAWAKDAVEALASNGYAKGQANNNFAPKANITRAEVVQLLDNIVKELVHKPGTYTNSVAGNVVVNTKDAVLEGIKVGGNVYLAEGIGLGDATLKNTEVAGTVFVAGGGVNSIHFEKAVVTGGVVVDTKAPVRLVSKNSDLNVTAKAKQNIVLTGNFKEVVVPADVVLELKGATVEKLIVVPSGDAVASITIDKDSLVKELTVQAAAQIKGNGKITLLKVEANGVTSTIKPSKTEVKDGIDAPQLPSTGGGGGGGGSTGGGSTGVVTPSEKPITVQSISLNDGTATVGSAITIDGKNITVDLSKVEKSLPKTIENATVTFGNLVAGDKITTVVDFPVIGNITLSDTVEEGGKVSYEVSDLRDKFNANKSVLSILNQGYKTKLETLLNQAGLSLEKDYLLDGSIDTATAIAKYEQILACLEENQNDADLQAVVQKIKNFLEQFNVIIDANGLSVTGKVTVKAGQLGETEYTVTIRG